jgi:hypothetical protein
VNTAVACDKRKNVKLELCAAVKTAGQGLDEAADLQEGQGGKQFARRIAQRLQSVDGQGMIHRNSLKYGAFALAKRLQDLG